MKNVILLIMLFIPINFGKIVIPARLYSFLDSRDVVIEQIKFFEGFRSNIYICPAGYKTIGYGHLVRSNENYTTLNEQEATDLLKCDFNKAIVEAIKLTNLSGDSLLAVSHFIFCFGSTKFRKSTLYKKLLKGKSIDDELLKWINVNGKPVRNLIKQREFEIKLLNYGTRCIYKSNSLTKRNR